MLLSILVILLGARALAPWAIASAVNRRLARIPEYQGHIGDVDLSLIRGAYAIDQIEIRKQGGSSGAPLFAAERIDFSIDWSELFSGSVQSEIFVRRAKATFVRTEDQQEGQTEADGRWREALQDLFPIKIARLDVDHGEFQFVDRTRTPHAELVLHDIALRAEGLQNRRVSGDVNELPAAVVLRGRTVGEGELEVRLRIAPLAPEPLFDLDMAVRGLPLPAYNSLLRAYANVDVSHGYFDLALEVAAREGAFRGYVKPFFRELDFENLADEQRPILGRLWESIVNLMGDVLENPDRQRLGTRVPFSGTFGEAEVDTWTAVVNAVRYGFGAAFGEAVEGSLRPDDVVPAEAGETKSK